MKRIWIGMLAGLLTACPFLTSAQAIIKGRVINSVTNLPVEFANVYINNSSTGGITDVEGYYEFESQLTGQLEIRASYVGFVSGSQVIQLRLGETKTLDFRLNEDKTQLADVSIVVERDGEWARNFKLFQRHFLGNEKNIQINNPFILEFTKNESGDIFAKANGPLDLTNTYLGYKIAYELVYFKMDKRQKVSYEGHGRYTELDESEKSNRWKKNRVSSYNGSLMHFLRALSRNRLTAEGFSTYLTDELLEGVRTNIEDVTEEDILREAASGSLIATNGNFLKVEFDDGTSSSINYRFSGETFWLESRKKNVLFSSEGFLLDPLNVIQHGSLSSRLFVKELPTDYNPPAGAGVTESVFQNFIRHSNDYVSQYPREKVYLDFLNEDASPGVKLFFDALLTAGPYHDKSNLSKILYVELIDPNCQLATYSTVRVDQGEGKGAIVLPKTLYSGDYQIRAYTEWMKNFDQGYYFHKTIRVGNDAPASPASDVVFFPGTDGLIEGMKQMLPFQTIDDRNKGVAGRIVFYSNVDGLVGAVITEEDGRGVLYDFLPKKGHKYHAQIFGSDEKFPLPTVQRSGSYLQVKSDDQYFIVTVKNRRPKSKTGLLIGHNHGLVRFMQELNLSESSIRLNISKRSIPKGICHFVLLDEEHQPISRFTVLANEEEKKIEDQYTAVGEALNSQDSLFLLNHLMINSEVNGSLVDLGNPANATGTLNAMQWTAYPWQEIGTRQYPSLEFEMEKGLHIAGVVTDQRTEKRKHRGVLHLLINGPNTIFTSEVDSLGRFEFQNINYNDTTSLVFSYVDKNKPKLFELKLDSSKYRFQAMEGPQPCGEEKTFAIEAREGENEGFTFDSGFRVLEEVSVLARRFQNKDVTREGRIYRNPTQTLVLDSLGDFAGSILDVLISGRFSSGIGLGVDSLGMQGLFVQKLRNRSLQGTFAMVLLDGVILGDVTPLYGILANEVDYVDVLTEGNRAIFGQQAFGGVIVIETKKGLRNVRQVDPKVRVRRLKGFTVY